MRVAYIGACLDSSGYAEAARNHIAALHEVGVKVDVMPVSFEGYKSDLGRLGILIQSMIKKNSSAKINILHVTPENYASLAKPDRYNIGYTVWETSKLPTGWAEKLNILNEVWVPCEHNVEVFKSSGVRVPVYCMPHPFDTNYSNDVAGATAVIANRNSDDYIFYSIYQWTERKNPNGMLKAYLTEFKAHENVAFVIKSYIVNPGSVQETQNIRKAIEELKAKLYLGTYPKILLITSLLSRAQIQSLHSEGDCYLSLHRCEGFGIPIVEAMLAANPVIATTYGGPKDFIQVDPHGRGNDTGYAVPHIMTPVYGMPWSNYTGEMEWAEPDLMAARRYMRYCYKNREAAKAMGLKGQAHIKKTLNWKVQGERMKARLEEIEKGL